MPTKQSSIDPQTRPVGRAVLSTGRAASSRAAKAGVAVVFVLLVCAGATSLSAQESQKQKKSANSAVKPAIETEGNDTAATPELENGFTWLFDGQRLDGWEGKQAWFRVEQGAIVAGSLKEKIPNNEFLCTREKYDDFELRLQVRLKGEGNNAGVQFRSARVPNDHEVRGYQCDVGAAFGRSVWGALYDESRRNKMLAEGPAAEVASWTKLGQWNDLWIRCQGDRIQLWLNEHPTVDYRETDAKLPRSGVIGLQIHSGPPTEAWYRAIRIRTLKKES